LFDLTQPAKQLRGHIGPISSLCLTPSCLYSGSWDYSVRVWRRGAWECVSVHKYQDWVWSVVARGPNLLVAAGTEVHVHDLQTGQLTRKVGSM
jgi:WD40 repeat protein